MTGLEENRSRRSFLLVFLVCFGDRKHSLLFTNMLDKQMFGASC